MNVEIPKIADGDYGHGPEYAGRPAWFQPVDSDGNKLKPVIRCNCGWYCGIGLHHVHADGTVTASFFHTKEGQYGDRDRGCEWHVFLKLLDYAGGEFLPRSAS